MVGKTLDVFDYAQLRLTFSISPNGHEADKKCFIRNCFAWCLEHQAISTESDGEEIITTRITDRDRSGNIRQRVEQETRSKCHKRKDEPEKGDYCDIVVSGSLTQPCFEMMVTNLQTTWKRNGSKRNTIVGSVRRWRKTLLEPTERGIVSLSTTI